VSDAIQRGRGEPALRAVASVSNTPGFLRRLRRRFDLWTRREVDPTKALPRATSAIADAEWTIYRHYRALMESLGLEDDAGFAVWASKTLTDNPDVVGKVEPLVVFEPGRLDASQWRTLDALRSRGGAIVVALTGIPEDARPEIAPDFKTTSEALFERGFSEAPTGDEFPRPTGLSWLVDSLFRDDLAERESADAAGFWALGAPKGEGHALVVAARLRRLLGQRNDPNEVVVVVPTWDEDAEVLCDTLTDWGIPFEARKPTGLARDPSVRALRTAGWLPAKGWEANHLVRILRNGRVKPDWPELETGQSLAEAAAAVQSLRVFRGLDAIRSALVRLGIPRDDARESDRRGRFAAGAETTLKLFDRFASALPTARESRPWLGQVDRLRGIARDLGIGGSPKQLTQADAGLDQLWLALEEAGDLFARLGQAKTPWTWADFMTEVDRVIAEVSAEFRTSSQGAIRVVVPEAYEGAACDHLVLANFTEGTYPRPNDRDAGAGDQNGVHESREATHFFRLVASARKSFAVVYPTTDEKGNDLLPAGFFDDLRACFTKDAWSHCHVARRRLDAVPSESLAIAPGAARLRAVALALSARAPDMGPLGRLVGEVEHRGPLDGVAAALQVNHLRHHSGDFGPFEGLLDDREAIRRIAVDFGPDRPAFSPSQLETLALCPFQFFVRFVLRLSPVEALGELEDDRARQGSLIHSALERLHIEIRDGAGDAEASLDQRVAVRIESRILDELGKELPPASDLEEGLREIRKLRLMRTGRRYVKQFEEYVRTLNQRFECHEFEVEFGNQKKNDDSLPALVVGEGETAVSLRGKIDRIDRILGGSEPRFRVIDYKSGAVPTPKELHGGLALQLPLYALAVERAGSAGDYSDFGYWGLRDKGYKPISLAKKGDAGGAWASYRERLERYVLELVAEMRRAKFPVSPRIENCTAHCDFVSVCRIKQVRASGKTWDQAPQLEPRE
jgi:ATP-dependent helicase/nuclease subunit B